MQEMNKKNLFYHKRLAGSLTSKRLLGKIGDVGTAEAGEMVLDE